MDNRKKIGHNKTLCILLMIILIVAGFFIGGMTSMNSRYETISYYRESKPVTYNLLAEEYNKDLGKLPGVLISAVMPVKGPLEYVSTNLTHDDGFGYEFKLKPMRIVGMLILLSIIGNFVKLFFGFRR
ncbi:MAG: hypothetical protein MJ171_00135 [Clostridia bacterium]|nr:hypothetical protein [Clostridia bacterium]